MTEQDVFDMAREVCGKWPSFMSNPNLQTFAKLVAAKVRKATLEEMIFAHPTTAIKLAVEKEREACAEIGDTALYQLQETMNELGKHEYMEQCVVQGAMNQAAKFTNAIRARGEA